MERRVLTQCHQHCHATQIEAKWPRSPGPLFPSRVFREAFRGQAQAVHRPVAVGQHMNAGQGITGDELEPCTSQYNIECYGFTASTGVPNICHLRGQPERHTHNLL